MRSFERSRREGFTSGVSIERERSRAMTISRDWSKTGSSRRPHWGRARATMPSAMPAQRRKRRRPRGGRPRSRREGHRAQAGLGPQDLRVAAMLGRCGAGLSSQARSAAGSTRSQRSWGSAKVIGVSGEPGPRAEEGEARDGEPAEELGRQEVALRLELDLLVGVDRLEGGLDRVGVGGAEEVAAGRLGDVAQRVLVQVRADPAVGDLLSRSRRSSGTGTMPSLPAPIV
jgi:hypothetical protein